MTGSPLFDDDTGYRPAGPEPITLLEEVDLAAKPRCMCDPEVGRDKDRSHRLGQRDIGGVVDGQVVAQLPTPPEQRWVRCALDGKAHEIPERELSTALAQKTGRQQSAKHRHHLQVEETGGSHLLTAQPSARRVTVGTVVSQGRRYHPGVNDYHDLP